MSDGDEPNRTAQFDIADLLASVVGIWKWDVRERQLYIDKRFAELTGLDPSQAGRPLPTESFFTPIHADDRLRVRIAVAGVMHGAARFDKQYRIAIGDGHVRWVSAVGRAEFDSQGRVLRFTGLLSDITAQKGVEERLRIAQTAGGVGTVEYIDGYGTAYVSAQFCRLLGLTPTDSVSLRVINGTLVPGDPPLIGDDGEHDGEVPYREFRIVRHDTGQTRWIARRGEVRRDTPGGGSRFIGVIYDVTEFKEMEDRLRGLTVNLDERVVQRTRDRDRVWNNSHDLLAILGPNGILRAVSPSWTRLLGYSQDELIGHHYLEFVIDEDAALARDAFEVAVSGRHQDNFENRYRHRDGDTRWISWNTSNEDGIVYAYGRDVTDDKARAQAIQEIEERLRQANKMEAVGQLTGGLAHDFNNMLTGIIGGLDLVRRRLSDGRADGIERFIDAAMTSAQRAAGLTHRLLAFARQQSLDVKSVDAGHLIGSMVELLSRTLGERIELRTPPHEQLWLAVSDINQLESALLNLAINARDAMPEGGHLTIRASNVVVTPANATRLGDMAPGDYVRIDVIDDGHGMPANVVHKAFDPFFTTKPIGQGTGLGLSMIYGFMRQIGGHAHIDSEVGRGTTVSMYLPRYTKAPDAATAERPPAVRHSARGQTVLVVEDESSVRALIVEVLDDLGYRVLEAADPQRALPALQSDTRIDLMITDVGLPGMNGRQLAEIARQSRPGLSILFVTGYAAGAVVRADFLEPGMQMISKPFAIDELAAKIGEMVGHGE